MSAHPLSGSSLVGADAKAAPNAAGKPSASAADWRVFPKKLAGKYLDLVPMDFDAHIPALWAAGGHDPSLWLYHPFAPATFDAPADLRAYYEAMRAGGAVSAVVLDKASGAPVGSYSFIDVQPAHRAHEIGAVWIAASHQKGVLNTEAVHLLLQYSFEVLGAYRVCWKTDSRNVISQAVASKLGATKEGVLRSHYIIKGGYRRDTVYYSWLDTEWAATRAQLLKRIADFKPTPKPAATAAAGAPSAVAVLSAAAPAPATAAAAAKK